LLVWKHGENGITPAPPHICRFCTVRFKLGMDRDRHELFHEPTQVVRTKAEDTKSGIPCQTTVERVDLALVKIEAMDQ